MSHVAIVGAGPAGTTLAYLLAHRGIKVTLLERRKDFAREFRGEVLMPSGIEALEQMGLDHVLHTVPNHTMQSIDLYMNARHIAGAELDKNSFEGRRPMAISQPKLLEALLELAAQSPMFQFRRGVSVKQLIIENGRAVGLRFKDETGEQLLKTDLVIGADGRNSIVRKQAKLSAQQLSPPMDVVWCKMPCPDNWQGVRAYAGRGHLLVAYHTWGNDLQLGWVILKGSFADLRNQGIDHWVKEMANYVSADFAGHILKHQQSVQHPFLLSVVSDCVDQWSMPGALVIGDAAHTMSPVAGQGVNIALRDAIVAANHLVPVLSGEVFDEGALAHALLEIEKERMLEVKPIQAMQANPPKLVLSRSWWGEPLRLVLSQVLKVQAVQNRVAEKTRAFPYGITEVKINV